MTKRNPQALIKSLAAEVRPDWMAHAACRAPDVDRSAFFVEHGDDAHAKARVAKAICGGCRVTAACLVFGDAVSPKWGTFAGLTAQERKARREALGRAA